MKNVFKDIFKGKIVIVGIGNPLRGDDGFGPAFIERLKGKISASCLDVGTAPENYLGTIAKQNPDTILFVDAVHLDLEPGQYEILKAPDILKSGFTTHDISPVMFIRYLESQTKADIYMLGVQPQNISFGREMSDRVKKALEEISKMIMEANNA